MARLVIAQDHRLTIDVAHLQPYHLSGAQSRPVGNRKRGLVLQAVGRRCGAADLQRARTKFSRSSHRICKDASGDIAPQRVNERLAVRRLALPQNSDILFHGAIESNDPADRAHT
jgi:hypothetical protein